MKIAKKILITIGIIFALLLIVMGVAFGILKYKTDKILDDYSSIYKNDKYKNPVKVENVNKFKQDVSCGYAVIEMFSKWNNGNITEKSLYDNYGKVVTSTGKAFEKEMNKQFPEYKTTIYKYLSSKDLIDKVYTSLSNGIPVPVEWAAKYEDE